LLGCCTNLAQFYGRLGVSEKIRWFDELTFIEPGGRASSLLPSFLPAPLHAAPSFLKAKHLSLSDKLGVARAFALMLGPLPEDSEETFLSWLQRHRQSPGAIEGLWKPVLVSALNEDLDRVSVRYAVQVFRESFLKSAAAGKMGVPSVPLSELYASAVNYIQARGGKVLLRTAVTAVRPQPEKVGLTLDSAVQDFDAAVLAAPFQTAAALLPPNGSSQLLKRKLEHFESSPITGIHLWFDREVTPLPHAVLLRRTI